MKVIALVIGKILILFSRVFKISGGSSFPGLVALRIDPGLVAKITRKLSKGTIVITGTNGKTTTAKHLSAILNQSGLKIIHNRTGSNLMRGIASALIEQSTVFGKPGGDIGLFEVDEATMPDAVASLSPQVVLVTNLFRDQLDRYGELDKITAVIGKSIEQLQDAIIILNADDPSVSSLAKYAGQKNIVKFFGLNESRYTSDSRASFDSKDCLVCGSELVYEKRFYSHLGVYRCPSCDFNRPQVDYAAGNIVLNGVKSSSFTLSNKSKDINISLSLSGVFNIYNSLAAYSAACALGIDDDTTKTALDNSSAAFGRMEKFYVGDKEVYLLLAKNPIGLTQIIETLSTDKAAKNFMLILNDNFADGTDVSWIWDADVKALGENFNFIYTSGIRAQDLTLRLKYEDLIVEKIKTINNIEEAFEKAVAEVSPGDTLYIITTYTGMLKLRNYLTRKGFVKGFWKNDFRRKPNEGKTGTPLSR